MQLEKIIRKKSPQVFNKAVKKTRKQALMEKKPGGFLIQWFNESASFRKNSDAYSRNTRNCNSNLLCPLHRNTSEGGRTFALRTVKDWNNLPRSLRTKKSVKFFKAELWIILQH